MRVQSHLGVQIPHIEQDSSAFFLDFNLPWIQEWIGDIPHGNFGSVAKSYYDFLQEFNRTELPLETRYTVIEFMLPHLTILLKQLDEHYLQDDTLPFEQKRKIGLLIEALCLSACDSYKLVLTQGFALKEAKQMVVDCLHRVALLWLSVLERSYKSYVNPPPLVWQEFHHLYQIAEKKGLATKEALPLSGQSLRHTHIQDAYKHALLLTCANPYRLRRKELYHLNFALESWAPLLKLAPYKAKNKDIFVVDMEQDLGPRFSHLEGPLGSSSYHLKLEAITERLGRLKQCLENPELLTEHPDLTDSELHLSPHVLKFLQASWSEYAGRSAERVEQMGSLRALLGIQSIFAACAQFADSDFSDMLDESSSDTEEIYMDALPGPSEDPSIASAVEYQSSTLMNISQTGLCLQFDEPIPALLKTGQLIAIEQNPEQPQTLSIGIICWQKKLKNHKTQCGIKLIGTKVHPVLTSLSCQERQKKFKTLWIPENASFHPYHTLITPALPFKEDSTVYSYYGEHSFSLLLENLVEGSSCFNQFHLHCSELGSLPFLQSLPPTTLDDVWDQIPPSGNP